MKKLLVILFALGLVFSFTAPVMATDVSFDGSFRVRGWYDSNSALQDSDAANQEMPSAYYDQRFRLQTVFQVVEGLSVTARFDAMDGVWGSTGMTSTTADDNIEFDMAYMTFVTGIGQFKAGYMSDGVWGTGFGDYEEFVGKIQWAVPIGDNLVFILNTVKYSEGDINSRAKTTAGTNVEDQDDDKYRAAVIYHNDTMQAGLLYNYYRYENYIPRLAVSDTITAIAYSTSSFSDITAHALVPYVKLTLGDLYIESELTWMDGTINSRAAGTNDVDIEGLSFYVKGQYNMGPVYLGALFAYVQGDDPDTAATETIENGLGLVNSGSDWDPMLILFNDTCPTTLGQYGSPSTATASSGSKAMTDADMDNGYIYQVFAGATFDKLSMKATLSYAEAHEDKLYGATKYLNKDYGTEFDITASYKLYDNLTYTVGAGYLWAGDYYKGTLDTNKVGDTYLLMNKLQVNF